MNAMTSTAGDKKTFWATEKDGRKLVNYLHSRGQEFQRQLRSGPAWARIERNLRMMHSLFFPGQEGWDIYELKRFRNGHVGAAAALFRVYVNQILAMATGDRLSFAARAGNSDRKSLALARLGPRVANHYFAHRGVIKRLKKTAMNCMWGNHAFLYIPWNRSLGSLMVGEGIDEQGQPAPPIHEGDFEFHCATVMDTVFDDERLEWENASWATVRTQVPRFELAALYPKMADKILGHECRSTDINLWWNIRRSSAPSKDIVYRYDFYHLRRPELPEGRHVVYLPGMEPLADEKMPYDTLPLFRCAYSEAAMSPMGYSAANDLQAPQEMANGILSSLTTNLSANAVGHIWQPEGEAKITASTYDNGLRILRSATKPEAVNFSAISPESFRVFDMVESIMERGSGVNAARLGQPGASLRSAKSLIVTIAQAFEAVSPFAQSYRDMAEEAATHIIKCIWKFGLFQRKVIAGADDEQYLDDYDPQDLEGVDRIVVEAMDPMANSYAGRVAQAEMLLNAGLIGNKQDFAMALDAGISDPMLRAERAERMLIQEENEALMKGEAVEVFPTNNHPLHLQEHAAILGSLRNQRDPGIRQSFVAHLTLHAQALLVLGQDPKWSIILSSMGIPVAPPMMGMGGAPGAPGGVPPQIGGQASAGPKQLPEASSAARPMPLRTGSQEMQ